MVGGGDSTHLYQVEQRNCISHVSADFEIATKNGKSNVDKKHNRKQSKNVAL